MATETQTTFKGAKVIRKFGNWTLEIFPNHRNGKHELVASDGYNTYYPIIYSNFTSAWDNPYPVPKTIITYVNKNAKRLHKMQERKN
jgi:hypothetical protein